MCSSNKGHWNIRLQLQHHFFSAVTVLFTPQLERLMDAGQLPGHVYFLSLVDAKYRAIWLYSALCWGRGNNPLAFILPLQGACSHLFLQVSVQAETPVRAAAVMRDGYRVPAILPSQLWAPCSVLYSLGASATSPPPLGLMALQINSQPTSTFYITHTLLLRESFAWFYFFLSLLTKDNISNVSLLGSHWGLRI